MSETGAPRAAVIVGSRSDDKLGEEIVSFLKGFGVECEYRVLSAHRNPDGLDAFVRETDADVFIAIAGLAAALPGIIASKTVRPVIGLPRDVRLGGLDALLSIVQMPPGIPVATVGIENWKNSAVLALEILAMKHPRLKERLEAERREHQ